MFCTMLGDVACIPFFFHLICLRTRIFKKGKLLDKKEGGTQNVTENIAGAVDPDTLSKHSDPPFIWINIISNFFNKLKSIKI